MTAVFCITYGHSDTQVEAAIAAARDIEGTEVGILDDSSGRPPVVTGVPVYSTPKQIGYAGAVNYLVATLLFNSDRLVVVNPDARISQAGIQALIASKASVAVPIIRDSNGLANIRTKASPWRESMGLAFGWRWQAKWERRIKRPPDVLLPLGKPWVPSGAVACFDLDLLRHHPLDETMFWLEMSDWARTSPRQIMFEIVAAEAFHEGGSSAQHAARRVALSQLAARRCYIRKHGSAPTRAFSNLALVAYLVRLTLTRQRDLVCPAANVWWKDEPWQTA